MENFTDNLIIDICIGLVLGDASINSYSKGVQLTFAQSDKNFDYFNQVYRLLSVATTCKRVFRTGKIDVRYNKSYKSICLSTEREVEFSILYYIFYDNGKSRRKMIPANISDYLTPIGLAHWISCDGQACQRGGIFLCTDSFTKEEVDVLIRALKIKFDIDSKISRKSSYGKIYWRIYISGISENWEKLKLIILPYLDKSMYYKIRVDVSHLP